MGKRKSKTANSTVSRPSSSTRTPRAAIPRSLLASSPQSSAHVFGEISTLCPGAVWVQANFLTEAQCQAWIDWSESQWEYTAHKATRYTAHRECFRIQRDDNHISLSIFERLQTSGLLDVVQREFPNLGLATAYQPVACNPNIRLYQYTRGMRFGKHVDGSDDTYAGRTEITLLIYLSDCQGGATRFWKPSNDEFSFAPKRGAILLHVHGDRCLEHAADPVTGGVKFILRSDICYRPV